MHSSIAKLATLALLPLLAACGDQATSAVSKPERPVQVQHVAIQSEDAGREYVGVVRPRSETVLGFRIAGKVTARGGNAVDRVRAGDVIARLHPLEPQLQVESARAELFAATSSLAQASADEMRYAGLKTRGYATVADYERK